VRIAEDDDDFREVRMEKVLAGRRRVKDVFDVYERNVRKEVWVIQGQNGNNIKIKLKSENWNFSTIHQISP